MQFVHWRTRDGRDLKDFVPDFVEQLEPIVGRERTVRVLLEYGGQTMPLARTPGPDSKLCQIIGVDAAAALGIEFCGRAVDVPLCREFLARHFRSQGLGALDIARQLRVSKRSVYRYLSAHRPR